MNHAQDVFSALIRPFKRTSSAISVDDNARRPGDEIEDGFLVVGETRSDRTTIRTTEFDSQHVDAPPSYDKQMHQEQVDTKELPSYGDYCRSVSCGSMETSSHLDPYMDSIVHSNNGYPTHTLFTHKTPVSDIPFVLHPQVQLVLDIESGFDRAALSQRNTIDWSQFDYDFGVENNLLLGNAS